MSRHLSDDEYKVVVGFALKIADQLESEFFNVMPISLAKSLVKGFLPEDAIACAEEKESAEPETVQAVEEPAEESSSGSQTLSQEEIERMLNAQAEGTASFRSFGSGECTTDAAGSA